MTDFKLNNSGLFRQRKDLNCESYWRK